MSVKYQMPTRIRLVRSSWREQAPDQVFGGVSLAQFEEISDRSLETRQEIQRLERATEAARVARDKADEETARMLELVVDGVKGTPGFGQDCALYRAFGYVRKSERKTGLTRKKKGETAKAEESAPLAPPSNAA